MQRFNQTVRATFNKGLITEASEMGFPQDASVDELNCDLTRKGTRRRRLGVKIEEDDVPSTDTYIEGSIVYAGEWDNVGGNSDLTYLVLQVANTLRFYEKGVDTVSSGEVKVSGTPYIINLSDFNSTTGIGASSAKVEVASIEGYLVVVSPEIDAFYIKANDNGTFSTNPITFRIRDFEWQGNKESYRTEWGDLNPPVTRKYDTYNAGWFTQNNVNVVNQWNTTRGTWPPLTHPWYSAKDSNSNFDIPEWLKITSGTSLLGNGHYILELFNPDRNGVSGLTGLTSNAPVKRFNTVTAFAGRVFFSGIDSKVYFSRIIEDISYIGDLYQVNDPTAETFNDLLDTDGGYIRLPDASGISKLHVFGASLMVFAKNGVWRISGVDDVFRATEFSVSKVSDFGLASKCSFVSAANNLPFWWSFSGIHSIVVTEQGGFREINLSLPTIQTFWHDDIGGAEKACVTGVYDTENNRVVWAYKKEGEEIDFKLNRFLIFDVDQQAFIPWEVTDDGVHQIVGLTYFDGKRGSRIAYTVIDEDGNTVVDSDGNTVVATIQTEIQSDNLLKLVIRNANGSISFASFTGDDFLDWGTENYTSFLVSSYNFMGDVTRRKTSPYITSLLKVTETGIVGEAPVRPSSIFISSFWDFKKAPATSAQQGYRLKSIPWGDATTFNYPSTIVATRLKLRGRGRVVSLRFESEEGKDFDLIGWETIDAINSNF